MNSFTARSGNYILISTIFSRLLSFAASWIALQLIPDKELGIVIYAFQIIVFIAPIASLGLNQSLVRFGSLLKSNSEKNSLFTYTLKKGVLICIGISIFTSISALFLNFEIPITSTFLQLLSISFITQFLFEMMQIQFRLQKRNKFFAFSDFTYNIILIILVFVLSYFFKELGYAIALVLTPLLAFILFFKKLNINWALKKKFAFINFSFWRYGFFASMSNVTTKLLISIDILLIGYLLTDMELVTAFKYVSLIPFSLVFLSQIVITTDFVNFTEKINQKNYIFTYIKNYVTLFSGISIGCIVFILLFGKFFLSLFDPNYIKYFQTLIVLTIGVSGILIFRGLFGNLISSIGKAHINFVINISAIILNIVLNIWLIPKYGLFGAAITSAVLMWFTGITSGIFFFIYYKKERFSNIL